MKPLIFIVDDNEDILFSLKITLESHDFDVITASSGQKALNMLAGLEHPPNIIISDIMMPNINGFELFKNISNDLRWSNIPFLFLSAKTSKEDIRFGKMLGVDDYLTKPIIEEDLLASIKGKLKRTTNIRSINIKVSELFKKYDIIADSTKKDEIRGSITLFYMEWDDVYGPILKESFSNEEKLPYSLKDVGFQLFNAAVLIYGQDCVLKSEGILLNIKNIDLPAYLYFDSYPDENQRSGYRQFMLAVIAPSINYFKSLQIKEVLQEIFIKIHTKDEWNMEEYTGKISKILKEKLI